MIDLRELFGHTAANKDSYSSFTPQERVRYLKMLRALRKQNGINFPKGFTGFT